jgi:hypothetical protein
MSKNERRPQTPKPRVQRVQGIRYSSAAGIHSGQGEYRRLRPNEILDIAIDELEDTWDGSYDTEW